MFTELVQLAIILLTCIYLTLTTRTARFMRAGAVSVWFSGCLMNACWVSEWMELEVCLQGWNGLGRRAGAGSLHSGLSHASKDKTFPWIWSLHGPPFSCEILDDHWRPDMSSNGKTSIHPLGCVWNPRRSLWVLQSEEYSKWPKQQ